VGAAQVFQGGKIGRAVKHTYLVIDLCSAAAPLVFSFHPRIRFYKHWLAAFAGILLTAVLFILWDIVFTLRGVWGFNPRYVIGVYFYRLPVEELLFFVCIPFACLFTYYCLQPFLKVAPHPRTGAMLVACIGGLLVVVGAVFVQRLYTGVTFISTGLLLGYLVWRKQADLVVRLAIVFPLLLIPFFIVNGLLTGTGLAQPVVWYNNAQNLGIRLLTIPLEDVVYGFEMILMSVVGFERFAYRDERSPY
jgi:lycopene cyclase domain-containing protein